MNINIIIFDFWGLVNTPFITAFIACGVSLGIAGCTYHKTYKQTQRNTICGFYTNLEVFIQRLRTYLDTVELRPLALLSADELIYDRCQINDKQKEQLRQLSKEMFDYLSHTSNQRPPKKNKMRIHWLEDIKTLTDYLIEFYDIDSGYHNSNYETEEGVKNAHASLDNALDRIENTIKKERKRLYGR